MGDRAHLKYGRAVSSALDEQEQKVIGPYSASYAAIASLRLAQYFSRAAIASGSRGWVSRYRVVYIAEKVAICISRRAFCLTLVSVLFTSFSSYRYLQALLQLSP